MEMKEKIDLTAVGSYELALSAVDALYGKQGFDLKLYHVEDQTVITDYYVICTGRSTTHIKALADECCYQLEEGGVRAAHVEGHDTGTWILLDFGNVIAHIFSREDRDYYKLERLMNEGTEVDITAHLAELDRIAKGE
ncbi:MAG: ribosome silencing factor [Clostridia bacterium]|nr:ribosome silencing factor [Clostridia bacterium]